MKKENHKHNMYRNLPFLSAIQSDIQKFLMKDWMKDWMIERKIDFLLAFNFLLDYSKVVMTVVYLLQKKWTWTDSLMRTPCKPIGYLTSWPLGCYWAVILTCSNCSIAAIGGRTLTEPLSVVPFVPSFTLNSLEITGFVHFVDLL